MNLETYYRQREENSVAELEKVKKRIRTVSIARVVCFLAGCIGLYYLYPYGAWGVIGTIACTLIPFLLLMKHHNRLFQAKDWWESSRLHYQAEIHALQGDVSAYEDGKEYIDAAHPYSLDLDVFGPGSLFQTLNRTCTPFGKDTLAAWMKEHLKEKSRIEARQEAVKELAGCPELREKFRITGILFKEKGSDLEELKAWAQSPDYFSSRPKYRWMVRLVPAINLLLFVLGLIGVVSMNCLGFSFGCFLVLSFGLVRKVTRIQEDYDKKLKMLATYARLIELLENEELRSPLLIRCEEQFKSNGQSASTVLGILSKELDRLDLRNNQLLYFLLEGSLFWQLRQMLRIERWKQTYGRQLHIWLETLGEMDALLSLGTFTFNRPDYTFPHISDKPFLFQAREMGHPLMPASQCVKNDADIPSRPYFIIITGANMAGKSTYLRTIGCNYLLACMGAPVCCSSLTIYPARLMTSLRTSDSLAHNESYFFAELKRLKQIIDLLNQGEEMFIILDEILKGTNSKDKQKGSFALVQQLMHLKANGIIATHDLLLGELVQHFPQEIKNYCFEADIRNDELSFSYKLREGIAQNMNACFLMKQMGLVIND